MKKITALVHNEFIKEFSKKSLLVILALVLALAAAFPFLSSRSWGGGDDSEYLERQLSWNEESIDTAKKTGDKSMLAYFEAERDALLIQKELGVTRYSDYRMDLINQYSALLQSQKAVEMASQGSLGGDSYLQLPPEAAGLDREGLKGLAGQMGAKVQRLLTVLRSGDPMQVASYNLEAQQIALQSDLNQQKAAEAAAKADPRDEFLAREAEAAKKTAEMQRARVALYQYRVDHKIGYGEDDYRSASLQQMEQNLSLQYEIPLDEQQFLSSQKGGQFAANMSYQQYLENLEKAAQESTEENQVLQYGLDNGVPPLYQSQKDPRTAAMNILNLGMLVSIVAVILGGSSIAREFSSGSIRLLLTRPVRRWKVYLGKYLTMVLVSTGLYLAMFLAMVLSSGLQLGFGGFASPVLAFAGGRVVSYNFWAYCLPRMAYAFIGILFTGSLAFCLSALTRNTAVSVALPIAANMGYSLVFQLCLALRLYFVRFTPVPYMDMGGLMGPNAAYQNKMLLQNYGFQLDPLYGGIMMMAFVALFYLLGLWAFAKRDVTN